MTPKTNPNSDTRAVSQLPRFSWWVRSRTRLTHPTTLGHRATWPLGHFSHHPHRPGAVLILIVVSLALITLMGGVYLQLARMDRESTRQTSNYIEAVRDSVIQQIQTELLDDLLNTGTGGTSGKFFDASVYIEPYDYPSNAATWPTPGTTGQFDDMWLASTTPDMSTGQWPKLSILKNNDSEYRYIAGNVWNGTQFTGTPAFPSAVIGTNDVNVPLITVTDHVDADGDGIPDSRWQWATLRQANNVQYVMAVRIIDNSSLINVNTATALTSDGTAWGTTTETRPRGYMPTDLDIMRMARRNTTGSWGTDVENLITGRGDAYVFSNIPELGLNTPGWDADTNWDGTVTPLTRGPSWLKRARIHEGAGKLLIYDPNLDEFELRYKGGLNSTTDTVLENAMPNVLRKDNVGEDNYGLVLGVGAGQYARWFQGDADSVNIKDRLYEDVRKTVTTVSGSAVLAYNADWTFAFDTTAGTHPTQPANPVNRRLKYDLAFQDGGASNNNTVRVTNIAEILKAIFKTGDAATFTQYLGLDDANADIAATQFALAIADYSDADDMPTKATIGTMDYYGLEALPFVREAYIQAGYNDVDTDNLDADSDPATGTDQWQLVPGSEAVVVELGNPFDRELTLDSRVRLVIGGAEYDLIGTIPARSFATFYVQPSADVPEVGYTEGDLQTSLGFTGTLLPAPVSGTLVVADGNDVIVKLQAAVDGGTYVTYDRLPNNTGILFRLPPTEPHAEQPIAVPSHGQGSMARDGRTIRYISNKGVNLVAPMRVPAVSVTYSGGSYDELGNDDKGIVGEVALDNVQLPNANRPFMSVADLGWIFTLGFSRDATAEPDDNTATGDLPQRLSGPFGNGGLIANGWDGDPLTLHDNGKLFLDTSPTAKVPTLLTAGVPAVPHAALVFDQFTVAGPAFDGLNNSDGSNGDAGLPTGWTTGNPNNQERVEQFVPGTININTAPLHIATLAAALPEGVDDIQDLMAAISVYRDYPGERNKGGVDLTQGITNLRNQPGIASIGELVYINPHGSYAPTAGAGDTRFTTTTPTVDRISMNRYGNNGVSSTNSPDSTLLLYPMPEDTGLTDPNLLDDQVQKMARFQYLAQNFTTRSDIYTAYILIHGYRNNSFTSTTPTERGRWIVIFDRSNVTRKEDSPKVLGVYKVN